MIKKYIYIAGPYTGEFHDHRSYWEIERNINRSLEAATALAKAGVGFFSPHGHSAHFEVIAPEVEPNYWYELDAHFMQMCDAILLLPGWERSKGSLEEKRIMESWGKQVLYSLESAIRWTQQYD